MTSRPIDWTSDEAVERVKSLSLSFFKKENSCDCRLAVLCNSRAWMQNANFNSLYGKAITCMVQPPSRLFLVRPMWLETSVKAGPLNKISWTDL
jgi:hypothetical protein